MILQSTNEFGGFVNVDGGQDGLNTGMVISGCGQAYVIVWQSLSEETVFSVCVNCSFTDWPLSYKTPGGRVVLCSIHVPILSEFIHWTDFKSPFLDPYLWTPVWPAASVSHARHTA